MKPNKKLVRLAIAIFFGLALILTPIISHVSLIQAAITWTKHGANPVLDEGGTGEWDFGGIGAAAVVYDDTTFEMWYTGVDNATVLAIGYATSSNGTDWAKYGTNPVLTKGTTSGDWDEDGVGSCSVIKESASSYKMWYTGYTDNSSSNIPAIGYATSTAGTDWTKLGSNPVLQKGSPGAFDDAGVMSPSVIWDADDSLYKMWYSGRAAGGAIGSLQIGYATSSNGTSWAKQGMKLPMGAPGDWDERGVGVGSVVKVGSTYHMWYTGYKGTGQAGIEVAIGHATSNDGITWTKDPSNPVLTKDTGWELEGVGAPWVIYGSAYQMWYSGLDTNFDPTLGYASYTVPPPPPPPPGGGGMGPPPPPPGVTDVSNYVDVNGIFIDDRTAKSEDGLCKVFIDKGTTGLTEDGLPLSLISIIPMAEPPVPPEDSSILGLVYDLGPDRATFDPPATLCITYDPALLPEGVLEENLVIVMRDEEAGEWVELEGGTVNLVTHTICAPVSHFIPSTVLAYARPAAFTRTLTIAPSEVDIGQTVVISIRVTNIGDLAGSYKVTLEIDEEEVATKGVDVAGGASQSITFTTVPDAAGTYAVNVNGLSGTFTVKAVEAPPVPTAFTVSALTIIPAEVSIGETVNISVLVTNTGDIAGSYEVTLEINELVVATKGITLAGHASERVILTTSRDVAGTYAINVNGLAGTFAVVVEVIIPTPAKPFNWWLVGGIIAGCIIIGMVTWLTVIRQRVYRT